MKLKTITTAFIAAILAVTISGCQTHNAESSGTHRMGTPKENYQMSNENMPGHRQSGRSTSTNEGAGTHRMGTPKENYQMSNENMRR
jgi:hypothetical protein